MPTRTNIDAAIGLIIGVPIGVAFWIPFLRTIGVI